MIFKDVLIQTIDTDNMGKSEIRRIPQRWTGYILVVNNMAVDSTMCETLSEFHEVVSKTDWGKHLPPYSTISRKVRSSSFLPLDTGVNGLSITVCTVSFDLLKLIG